MSSVIVPVTAPSPARHGRRPRPGAERLVILDRRTKTGGCKDLEAEDARARMLQAVGPGSTERVALDHQACGRILAEDVAAIRDQPPFDASAMDGYAVQMGGDAASFRIVGESRPGRPSAFELADDEAVRIYTGAAVPAGCAVVVQERATRQGEQVRFTGDPPRTPTHVRPRGGDFREGDIL